MTPQTLARTAMIQADRYEGNLEDSVSAVVDSLTKEYDLTPSFANSIFYQVLEACENMSLEDRAQWLKDMSETCEKWYDPKTGKTFYVNVVNGSRDWANAK